MKEREVKFYGNFLIPRMLQKFRRYFKKIIVGEMFWNIFKRNKVYKIFKKHKIISNIQNASGKLHKIVREMGKKLN